VNWNWVMQTGSALATYVALMGAFLAGFSPLEFALYSAILLCLWLSLYSMASIQSRTNRSKPSLNPMIPSLTESMSELHSLQCEINSLQAQFAAQTTSQRNPPDNSAV